ncbi:MAG: alkaline phosphatase family protein [Planctomycetota bacterium]
MSSGISKKVLIVGLDGATWDVLDPLIAEGRMPRLKQLRADGASGIMHSTVPPITPAAWTTFLTGRQPGSHGIIDFERYDPPTHQLCFNSTRCLDHVRSLWRILGDHGLRVGSINVPMTYPAVPVNGFMISGFETPSHEGDFVYPRELKADVLARWPDPTLKARWKRRPLARKRAFRENIDYIRRSFHQGVEMTRVLGERFGWDAMMVVLKLVDNLQHKTWRNIDARWRDEDPSSRDLVRDTFVELDVAVGELIDYAKSHEAAVFIVSDHGHGSLEGKIQPNLLLNQWGYLKIREGAAQSVARGRNIWDRMRGRTKKFARQDDITHDLAVDFGATQACVMHAGMAGFLYINLKGRQPCGIVPLFEFERLRDELRGRFLGEECRVRDPQGREIQLFEDVHKPEDLYRCSRQEQPWLPDLMLIPHRSLAVVRKIRGRKAVRWVSEDRIEGTHRPEGVFAAWGNGVVPGRRVDLGLVDCAPTILTMLGLPIPKEMEGRVATEIFEDAPTVAYETAEKRVEAPQVTGHGVYSSQDLEQVTARLSDLGYLE